MDTNDDINEWARAAVRLLVLRCLLGLAADFTLLAREVWR